MANRAFARIPNVSIPQGSEVFGVFARITAYSNLPGQTVNLRCAFVNADDPDAPTTYSQLQAYTVTDWIDWGALETWTANELYDTPDLTNTLQQVIDRTGWQTGNALILIIEDINSNDQRSFISVRVGDNTNGVVLFVQYRAVEGSSGSGDFSGEGLPPSSEWCTKGDDFPPVEEDGQIQNGQFVLPSVNLPPGGVRTKIFTNWYGNITMASVDWDITDFPTNVVGTNGYIDFGLSFLVYGGGPYQDTINQTQYLCELGAGESSYANGSVNSLFGPRIELVVGNESLSMSISQHVGPYSTMFVGDGISGANYASTTIHPWTGGLTGTWRIEYAVTSRAMVNDIWYPHHNEFKVYINNSLVFHTQFSLNSGATSPMATSGMGAWKLITDKHLFSYMGFQVVPSVTKGAEDIFASFSNFTTVEDFRQYNYWQNKNPISYLDWDEFEIASSGPSDGAPASYAAEYCTPPAFWFNGQCYQGVYVIGSG